MRHSRVAVASGVVALVSAAGAAYVALRPDAEHGDTAVLARFSDSGVTVTVGVKDRTAGRADLAVTFTPDRPGFHLYSIDLPALGIRGVGRPTKVAADGVLHATGPESTASAVTMLPLIGTSLTLPVYPDGPVTVDLPVAVDGTGPATLLIGYAACSPQTCLPPVTDHPVAVTVTEGSMAARQP